MCLQDRISSSLPPIGLCGAIRNVTTCAGHTKSHMQCANATLRSWQGVLPMDTMLARMGRSVKKPMNAAPAQHMPQYCSLGVAEELHQ